MEHPSYDRGLAQGLAEALRGPCYRLAELKATELYRAVRERLEQGAGDAHGPQGRVGAGAAAQGSS
jgi:hypothetical protein